MTYPLFVVAVAVVVLIIVMAKVIPTLADVFADLGGTLPLMTRMLIATSHFFAKWWLLMLAVLAFLKIGSQVYGNTPQGRIEKAKIMLSLPLVGAINQMNGAAQFANTMSVLLAAGITINQAVDTTAKVMDNALLSEDVRSMREGIERGRSLVECLQGKKYFPPTMVDMCSVGEETDEIEETLDNVADYYANEADYRIQRLLALLEPTMLVVLAIFAGIIVVSIYLPIFTMYDLMCKAIDRTHVKCDTAEDGWRRDNSLFINIILYNKEIDFMKGLIKKVRENKKGFTLAELLVAVAIVGILVATDSGVYGYS